MPQDNDFYRGMTLDDLRVEHRSDCATCARRRYDRDVPACDAFPAGIPDELAEGQARHREPYPGDGGRRYLPRDSARTARG